MRSEFFFGELGTNIQGLTTTLADIVQKIRDPTSVSGTPCIHTLSVTTNEAPDSRDQTDVANGPASEPRNTDPAPTVMSQIMAPTTERPYFNGKNVNPIRFLEALERYFRRTGTRLSQQLDLAIDCLGDGAMNWADVCKTNWANYEEFRWDFVRNYWSLTEQNQLRRSIGTDKWNPAATSMIDHLTLYVSEARLLNPPLPDAVLISELVQHFPMHIQAMWQANDSSSLAELINFVKRQTHIAPTRTMFDAGALNMHLSPIHERRDGQGRTPFRRYPQPRYHMDNKLGRGVPRAIFRPNYAGNEFRGHRKVHYNPRQQ